MYLSFSMHFGTIITNEYGFNYSRLLGLGTQPHPHCFPSNNVFLGHGNLLDPKFGMSTWNHWGSLGTGYNIHPTETQHNTIRFISLSLHTWHFKIHDFKHIIAAYISDCFYNSQKKPGPENIKLFSCSTQLSMQFKLINIKIAKIIGIVRVKSSKSIICPAYQC